MDPRRAEELLRKFGDAQAPDRLLRSADAPRFWERVFRQPVQPPRPRIELAWPLLYVVGAVAAAILLVILIHRDPAAALHLQTTGAATVEALWRPAPTPHAAHADRLVLGARVANPAFVNVVALTDTGRVIAVRGNDGGVSSLPANSSTALGEFALVTRDPRGAPARIVSFVVLASPTPLPEERFDRWVTTIDAEVAGALRPDPLQIVRSFQREFDGAAQVVAVPA